VSDDILRFRRCERELHWALAVPFLISYATAVLLVVVYNPHPERPLREVVSWVHKISGLSLILLPSLTVFRHRRDVGVYLRNVREGWVWRSDDVKWLFLMGPATINSKIALPHQGKFNAAEKINFMVLMCTYPLYIVTGVLIWLPGVALLAWLLHFSMAMAATPLIFGHMFMATINPDTRVGLSGMITGFVDREWARHHYRRWYDEHFDAPVRVPPRPVPAPVAPAGAPALPPPHQVVAAIPAGQPAVDAM
jgi:formate dehydrogenase gamma subunit